MKPMQRAKLLCLLLVLLLVLLLSACGGSGGASVDDEQTTAVTMVSPPPVGPAVPSPTPPEGCLPALSSARGSVAFGDKACSPDKMLYAREEEPQHQGRIGIYERATDKQLKIVKVTQGEDGGDAPNEIKGLAWSPDSRLLAVMYHQSGGGSISLVDVRQGQERARLNIKGQPHLLEFTSQTQLKAGDETVEIAQ